ncbi:MAG TPA: NAD(P)-dependent oxidoreductase [Opitutaceae bacterium]
MLNHRLPTPLQPKRVVVLGATGFVSSHLRRAFEGSGTRVRMVGSEEIDLTRPESAAALAKVIETEDTVVMTSMLTPDKGRDFRTSFRNLQMAETVCRALETRPCAHFLYLSSDAVYDGDGIPLDEKSSRQPVDLYGLAHSYREMLVASVLAPRGIPYCVLRPTNIFGPGNSHDNYGPNRFVRTAIDDRKILLFGHGEEHRSHLYVDDAVWLINAAILRRSEGILNLAADPPLSFLDVAEAVARNCSEPVKIDFAVRAVPLVHRPYNVSALFGSFPDFEYTPFERGIRTHLEFARQRRLRTNPEK